MLAARHRVLIALPLMAIAIAAGVYLAGRYGSTVSRLLHQPPTALRAPVATAGGAVRRRHPPVARPSRVPAHDTNGSIHTLLVGLALTWAGAIPLVVIGLGLTVRRRFANRLRRHYERYPLNLTMHDEAKPKDLDDMIEAIANAIRPPLQTRWRDGQPFIAIELIHRETDQQGVYGRVAVRGRPGRSHDAARVAIDLSPLGGLARASNNRRNGRLVELTRQGRPVVGRQIGPGRDRDGHQRQRDQDSVTQSKHQSGGSRLSISADATSSSAAVPHRANTCAIGGEARRAARYSASGQANASSSSGAYGSV